MSQLSTGKTSTSLKPTKVFFLVAKRNIKHLKSSVLKPKPDPHSPDREEVSPVCPLFHFQSERSAATFALTESGSSLTHSRICSFSVGH